MEPLPMVVLTSKIVLLPNTTIIKPRLVPAVLRIAVAAMIIRLALNVVQALILTLIILACNVLMEPLMTQLK
jgi:hypothetical protein